VGDQIGVHVSPYDVTLRVDPVRFRVNGPGEVNCSEGAVAQQKAVPGATGIQIPANDLPFGVDVEYARRGFNGVGRPWEIDGGETDERM
jgi:hypothetical protein